MTPDSSMGSRRPMGIFWDMKSCQIPAVANDADLAKNITAALRHHLPNHYPMVFFAYGDRGDFPSHLLSRWERDGLTVHNVCGGVCGDYNLHKQMLTHMMDLAIDHPYPQGAGMVLIPQESDHVDDLWRLGLLGYPGVLVCSSGEAFPEIPVSGWFVSRLDWLSVARGSGQIFPMDDRAVCDCEVKLLRKMGGVQKLGPARDTMGALFPSTPTMWQQWAPDEASLMTEPDGYPRIEKLHKRGVKNYLVA